MPRRPSPLILSCALALAACSSGTAPVVYEPPTALNTSPSPVSGSRESSERMVASATASAGTQQVSSLPPSVRIKVPFGVQAPHANWNPPYDEACEEASLVLVKAFLDGESSVTPEEMDRRILDMIAREKEAGLPIDITTEELARVAEEKYGLTATVTENPAVDDIKRAIAAGHPVIVPLAGRDIGNPYYSGEGPWYHMLVIVGYDAKHFYTNDVGTRRGENYKYRQDVLYDAIHDWTGVKENIREGKKVMLVIERM